MRAARRGWGWGGVRGGIFIICFVGGLYTCARRCGGNSLRAYTAGARRRATFPRQPVPWDGRLRSNLCSVSETQLNFKTICKYLRPVTSYPPSPFDVVRYSPPLALATPYPSQYRNAPPRRHLTSRRSCIRDTLARRRVVVECNVVTKVI